MSVASKAAAAKAEADPAREAQEAIAAGLADELEEALDALAQSQADAEAAVDDAVEAKETFLSAIGTLRSGLEARKEDPEGALGYAVGYLDAVLGIVR